jgi:hypothetical protein
LEGSESSRIVIASEPDAEVGASAAISVVVLLGVVEEIATSKLDCVELILAMTSSRSKIVRFEWSPP